jgi:outer membrane protein assembly factor BamB
MESHFVRQKKEEIMKGNGLFRWLLFWGMFLLIVLATSLALAGPAADDGAQNWPHFGCDDAYTAYNPIESTIAVTNVMQLQRRWGIGCNDAYFSVIFRSPAIFDDRLYTSGAGDRLRAFDARTGQYLWQFGTGNMAWAPQPTVSEDGVVFYMEETYPTYLYAVDGQSGSQIWKAPLGFELGYSGAAEAIVTVDEANGLVYLLEVPFSGGGKLYAIDKQTGEVSWWMGEATDNADFTGNYALLQEGKIYAPADVSIVPYPGHGDKMLRIDPATQAIELAYERPEPENYWDIEAYTLCGQNLVTHFDYQYDPVKLVVAYDTYTSTIAWQTPFSETITGKIACNPDKGQIYVPTDPYLYALDLTTGDEIWKYTGYGAIYNPSVANGLVYFLSDNNMYALDEETKAKLLTYPLGYEADETTQVAIADGMLFFSGNGGTCDLFALGFPADYRIFLPLVLRE